MINKDDCVICLDEINNNIKEYILLECNHYYHNNCFSKYIVHNLKKIKQSKYIQCPLCRRNIRKEYILREFVIKFYDLKDKTYKINREKNTLQNKLFFMNFKKCLWFKKKSKLILKEEEIMEKINDLNNQLINKNKQCDFIKKIYYNLIDNNIEYLAFQDIELTF